MIEKDLSLQPSDTGSFDVVFDDIQNTGGEPNMVVSSCCMCYKTSNSENGRNCLDGFILVVEDWHIFIMHLLQLKIFMKILDLD